MAGWDIMRGRDLQKRATERAEQLPAAELTHPFGDDWDVYKVRGRVFMLQTDVRGQAVVTVKSAPEDGRRLREEFDDISPGYHMNKKHWITLLPGGGLDASLVDDLVTESYLLVVEKLAKKQRPVDPTTFGTSGEGSNPR
jgi:predicted DNA-binding protein (MmcQ/YjbR family)